MDFRFTDEQRMLQDTAQSFLASVSDSAAVRRAMVSNQGFDPDLWQRLCAEMYWQGILVPEQYDGLGLGVVDLVIALEQQGVHLACSPLYASAVAALMLRSVPESEQTGALLAQVAAGSVIALAHTAARPAWGVEGCAVAASANASGWTLSGEARFVPYGHAAESMLVVAREQDGTLSLFHVASDDAGVTLERAPTMDQTRAMATLTLNDATLDSARRLATDVEASVSAVVDLARILASADLVGVAQASLDSSVDYVQERVQFGRTIASFQAIKHKAADMMLKVESARSLAYYAACVADEWLAGTTDRAALAEAAAMLSASAGEAAFFCAGTGIQMHGGVGITEEYDIQLYFKRARAGESYLGSPAAHRETVAAQLLDGD